MKNCYEVVYSADNKFAPIMGISIISLFKSNIDAKEINITILDSGISRSDKDKIELICQQFHRKLPRWVSVTNINDKLSLKVKSDRGSLSQFARLFLGEAFPKNVSRVLYLDCDTIVVSSINNLWNTDLKGNTVAVVKDAFSKYYRGNIGLSNNAVMFNSGLILIDLEKWRNNNVEEKLIEFIRSRNGKVQQGDQGVLNAALSGKEKILTPEYNLVSLIEMMDYKDIIKYRKPVNFYSRSDILRAKKEPVIIHYTSGFYVIRPWITNSNHPQKDDWLKYKQISPWKNRRLERNVKSSYYIKLFHLLPFKIALSIAGFLQAYVRPYKNKLYSKINNVC